MFWDSENLWHHFRAGASLGPVGNGRTTLSAGSLTNIFPGIVNMQTGAALPIGSPLPLSQLTNMSLAQYIQIYDAQIPALGRPGIVLSTGEFGERLADHARRAGLEFHWARLPWGAVPSMADFEEALDQVQSPGWMWRRRP